MQIQYAKNLNPGRFELSTTSNKPIGLLFISRKTWFKHRHSSDAEGEKPDTRFLLLTLQLSLVLPYFGDKHKKPTWRKMILAPVYWTI